ncbi:tyrosyl-DNA phosphodiesterase-domain-containing protein [Mycotypha africana]|uniref:tyrosyl-DNA phosphodiesterase-domain-containing protein n=1 Tax=Mycotypha africana TaxID=64632 RepID=UPI002300E629|nr:tyrosyl-DNA phosphodiesterase-domain-containing protein [Mycotypha africana]KAI8984565.1 tyrosyl-DNA phosphodiesterase-domain-containing protein [Mycotypha africana]
MNNSDNEEEQFARAVALSLQSQIMDKEKEDNDLKVAIAASLGKSVDQLTARDLLMADVSASSSTANKTRGREDDSNSLSEPDPKRLKHTETKYWDGTIKLTYVKGFTGPDYVRFEDIIQKKSLKKAMISAFVHSMDYIEQHFPADINICIVTHGRPQPSIILIHPQALRKQIAPNRIIIYPPLTNEKFGCFHIKLMLLFHENSLRVVIGSANLVDYDYEDLENVIFMQDFPKLNEPHASFSSMPEFAREIAELLDQMTVPVSVKEAILHYDFSRAKAQIIASISGTFEGINEYQKYGHIRLAKAVQSLTGGIVNKENLPHVEMQTSSLGSMSVFYLQELFQSFCGLLPYRANNANTKLLKKDEMPPVDIIYPTLDTVNDSRLGAPGASTICLSRDAWNKPSFPKQLMHDAISVRPGTLMHSKYIITTFSNAASNRSTTPSSSTTPSTSANNMIGWLYVGSHNATMSAWGKYTLSRDSKKPKLRISNWELGVVLPMYENSDYVAPYLRPAPQYQPNQQAWTQNMNW